MTALSTTYTPGKLLIAVVGRDQGETVMAVAKEAGARGGTIMLGRGVVDNRVLRWLGLDEKDLDVVFTLLSHEETPPVLAALGRDPRALKMAGGIVMALNVTGILRHVICPAPASLDIPGLSSSDLEEAHGLPPVSSKPVTESASMSSTANHILIAVIVNTGFADDVMAAARKAGAPGGTIINARGTGKEEDVKFFGISIVPEKEFIMILVPKEQANSILEAVRGASCLDKPGAGIAFCLDVERFMALGRA